jgi:5'/3'-nucleotidase SurE
LPGARFADATTGPSAVVSPLCGAGPLEILLTNDDGFDAAGIRALRARLVEAGHRVMLVAPERNASGSAMSFTWGTVRVTRDASSPGIVSVSASPATAVVLGATALYPPDRRPDLVISGINDGTNAGALLALSGTVGAALAGTVLLDPPVPGFAVNVARTVAAEPIDSDTNRAQLDAVARHVTQLIGAHRSWFCDGGRLAHPGTVLNVNYPARPVAQLNGSRLTRQGSTSDLRIGFEQTAAGEYTARTRLVEAGDDRDSDNYWLAAGYVTITPIGANLTDDRNRYD